MTTVHVRSQLTFPNRITLPPKIGTECEVHRRREAKIHWARDIESGHQLFPQHPSRVEGQLIRDAGIISGAQDAIRTRRTGDVQAGPQRGVVGVRHVVIEVVVPELGTQLVAPPRYETTYSAGCGIVGGGSAEGGQKAQRVQLGPVPCIARVAPVGIPAAVPVAVPSKAVDLGGTRIVERQAEVREGQSILLQTVPPVMVRLIHGIPLLHYFAVHDGVGNSSAGVFERIGPGPIGWLPVAKFSKEPE